MLGTTCQRTLDAALDEIGRLHMERDNALDALLELSKQHPELESNLHFTLACLALL
jgi:hypothetical protein